MVLDGRFEISSLDGTSLGGQERQKGVIGDE
jgi:hypothetical protein